MRIWGSMPLIRKWVPPGADLAGEAGNACPHRQGQHLFHEKGDSARSAVPERNANDVMSGGTAKLAAPGRSDIFDRNLIGLAEGMDRNACLAQSLIKIGLNTRSLTQQSFDRL